MLYHRIVVSTAFGLILCLLVFSAGFLVLNLLNPVALVLNILCGLVLIGAVVSLWQWIEPFSNDLTPNDEVLQRLGRSVADALGYRPDIVFLLDREMNASASRQFGFFGQRIVHIGEPFLATRDLEFVTSVLAHEVSHLRHRDSLITAVSWTAVSWLSNAADSLNPFRQVGTEDTTIFTLLARVLLFLFFLPLWGFLTLVRQSASAISHELEFRADRGAAALTTREGVARTFALGAYAAYFNRENNYELYRERVTRFLAWLPIPEADFAKWIQNSTESESHPSAQARYEQALRWAGTEGLVLPGHQEFVDLCERIYRSFEALRSNGAQ